MSFPLKAVLMVSCLSPVAVSAQDVGMGQAEYMSNCAQCHGVSGEGDGIIAGFLNSRATDLTILQANNGGVFPLQRIYELVDGTAISGIHGSREMPAWGASYSREAPEMLGFDFTDEDRDIFVRGRILALVEYLSTIQKQ